MNKQNTTNLIKKDSVEDALVKKLENVSTDVKAEYKGRRVIENTTGGKYFTLVNKVDKGKRSTVKEVRMDLVEKIVKFTKYKLLGIVDAAVCDKHISRINEVLTELEAYKEDDKIYQTTVYRTTVRNGFKNIISRADKKIEAMSA